jgi:signal transduction histidine kinase
MTDVESRRRRRWAVAGWSVVIFAAFLVFTLLVTDYLIGDLTFDEIPLALAFFSYAAVGAVLMVRVPGHRLGPLFAFIGLAPMFGAAIQVLGLRLVEPGAPPPAPTALMGEVFWNPTLVLALVFPALLFPTGHPPTRRWSWVGWGALVLAVGFAVLAALQPDFVTLTSEGDEVVVSNPIGIANMPDTEESALAAVGYVALGVLSLSALASLVVRYRRADVELRAQLKWLLYAVALLVLWVVTLILVVGSEEWAWSDLVFSLLLAGIPVSAAVAILRYRLLDIDVVISKTLVYGVLAVFVTVVYVALVVGVGTLVVDSGNLVLSIVATAVVAVAFQPVRNRVQRLVNRVVYGERATPYELLSELSGRMAFAQATEELVPRIATMVGEGIGAARVEVWLRVGPDLVREAEWSDSPRPAFEPPVVVGEHVSVAGADASVAVRHQGELLGVISVAAHRSDPLNSAEEKLLEDLAAQAGLVLRNVRLVGELRRSRQRLVTAQDEERRRLERNLHDGAQQRLVSIALGLRLARGLVESDGQLGERLDKASEELDLALSELRDLARGIHPAILTDRGLMPAVVSLTDHSAVPASVESTLERRLPAPVEATGYFVVAEGLANAAKYSQATLVRVVIHDHGEWLDVEVSDDGVGGADPTRGSGLRGLADRVEAVGGTIEVHSPPTGGTVLRCRIPAGVVASTVLEPASLIERTPVTGPVAG